MIEFNQSDCRMVPFKHQRDGTLECLRHSAFALFDEMGAGKSKQVIDAACALRKSAMIELVVVVCPASCKIVWTKKDKDPELTGEIHKHGWASINHRVIEFHSKKRKTHWREVWKDKGNGLIWVVTNFEYIREKANLNVLLNAISGRKVAMIIDEGSYIKNHKTDQTKAIFKLREKCIRRYLLNGTPIVENPLDLWSQFEALDPQILGNRFDNFWAFRWRYAVLKKISIKAKTEEEKEDNEKANSRTFFKAVSWQNIPELQAILRPYCLRREKKDCLDLPEKLYTTQEIRLTEDTWRVYQELRKTALAFLPDNEEMLVEPNAAVRLLRLAQLTSGLLGGRTEPVKVFTEIDGQQNVIDTFERLPVKDFSNEKLNWCKAYLQNELAGQNVIIWTRWRRERERLVEALQGAGTDVFALYGGQARRERDQAISAFMGRADSARRILVAQPHAGGHGLTLTAAHEVIYLSNDYSLAIRLQSEDRPHRPGQHNNVTYVDALATGPEGQQTIDHVIRKAQIKKEEVARFTCARWRRELEL